MRKQIILVVAAAWCAAALADTTVTRGPVVLMNGTKIVPPEFTGPLAIDECHAKADSVLKEQTEVTKKAQRRFCRIQYDSKWTVPISPAMPPGMAAVDRTKLMTRAAGFSTVRIGPGQDPLDPATTSAGDFRMVCLPSHMNFDDPIVYPGQVDKSHLHLYFGNTGTNAFTTTTTIANSGNSTCSGGIANRSSYWVPPVIDTRTGTPIVPRDMMVYYKWINGIPNKTIEPFPVGLRMIAGNAPTNTASQPDYMVKYRWACVDMRTSEGLPGPIQSIPASCAAGNEVWVNLAYPNCWDGVNLDSPNHRSHMAYSEGDACPTSHPVHLPDLAFNIHYPVTALDDVSRWRLSSDMYAEPAPGGYSMHGDVMMGWVPEIMEQMVQNCLRSHKDCHVDNIGNAQRLIGPSE
jgi:hypothetical protein